MNYWVNVPPMSKYRWMARVHEETCYTVPKFAYGDYTVSDWRVRSERKSKLSEKQSLHVAKSANAPSAVLDWFLLSPFSRTALIRME